MTGATQPQQRILSEHGGRLVRFVLSDGTPACEIYWLDHLRQLQLFVVNKNKHGVVAMIDLRDKDERQEAVSVLRALVDSIEQESRWEGESTENSTRIHMTSLLL